MPNGQEVFLSSARTLHCLSFLSKLELLIRRSLELLTRQICRNNLGGSSRLHIRTALNTRITLLRPLVTPKRDCEQ